MTGHTLLHQPHLFYGGDYNPEQWPEETWQEDVRLMQAASVNLVSLGIFSWARLEPRPGEYDFGWFDRILDLLHTHGIRVCLATATASPPPWLAKHHPESLPVTADGVKLWPGGRQHYCPHNSAYRQAAAALVRQIAWRYGQHPALAVWHINNEYGCHAQECYCDVSAAAFREWLRQRYDTLETLNTAWGTAFWSQQYSDWDEINPPRRAPTFTNPTQQLDWKRFSSDSLLELFEMERDIIRQVTPQIPITTNFLGFWKPVNYWKWAKREDVTSLDCYPDPADPQAMSQAAIQADLIRSLGGGQPWFLMEQAPSAVNWQPHNIPKRPGQMRLWSYQAVARGANAIMFFQWRASKAGTEKFHSGMLPHVGTQSRVWREVVQLGNELRKLGAVIPARVSAEVAILFDWESWWALELDSKPSFDLRMMEQLATHYAPLFLSNILVDFAEPESNLSPYKLVVVPNLYLVTEAAACNLTQYVEGGGTLVMSFFSGIVNEHEHIWIGGYPAPFRRMLGLRVEEFVPHVPGQTNGVRFADGSTCACSLWSDVIDLEGAEALGTFTGDFYAGRPAVTRRTFGKGKAYYIGTRLDTDAMARLIGQVCIEAGVEPPLVVPAGVEVVRREGEGASFLFLLNHNLASIVIDLGEHHGTDLLTGQPLAGKIELEPLGVRVVKFSVVHETA